MATQHRSASGIDRRWAALAGVVIVVLVAIVAAVRVLPSPAASQRLTAPLTERQAQAGVPADDSVLTPVAARVIAAAWFRRRDTARYDNDNAALGQLETGAALRVDRAFTRQILCGCEPPKHSHILQSVDVVVPSPHSSTFLAHFASTASNGVHAGYTVVLTRASGRWKAALVALDGHRTTVEARHHAKPIVAVGRSSAVVDAAAYLMHWLHVGSAPRSGITWTGDAHYAGHSWAALGRGEVDPHTGVRRTDYSAVSDGPAYSFPIAGGTLTCGVIDASDIASVPSGELLQSTDQHQWGPTIAPGVYPALQETTTLETCVISRPHHVRDLLSAYGEQTGITPGSQPAV